MDVKKSIHRDYMLNNELHYVVLRMVQLRDSYLDSKSGMRIYSVKYRGVELKKLPPVKEDLFNLSAKKAIELCAGIGYVHARNLPGSQIVSKIDLTVNGKNYSIRCMNYTDRALVNHSHRRKYEAVCNRLGIGIEELDEIIFQYWTCRDLEVFNEDCFPYSSLNPFLEHKDYLDKLLSYMAFRTLDFSKPYNSDDFVAEEIDKILDYTDPWDESTWRLYSPTDYFQAIWPCLCFSMRDTKGMPKDEVLLSPEYSDVRMWVRQKEGKYKGALHVRIKKFDAEKYKNEFASQFETVNKEEIEEVRVNQGELDEYLVKLFLIDCRRKGLPVPIGDSCQVVKSVASSEEEYGNPRIWLDWGQQQPKLIVYICKMINAGKAPSLDKADVFVNNIGISIKSERGAAPSIINHTARHNILRVMKEINQPIGPLDQIIDRYWFLRLNGRCTEDVDNSDKTNPFYQDENGHSNKKVLVPLLNYFTFHGTGTQKSKAPAKYVLSVGIPDDTDTWRYYDESDFVDSVWQKLRFSIRAKGLPTRLTDEMLPWVREIDGTKKGSLSVRVNK